MKRGGENVIPEPNSIGNDAWSQQILGWYRPSRPFMKNPLAGSYNEIDIAMNVKDATELT